MLFVLLDALWTRSKIVRKRASTCSRYDRLLGYAPLFCFFLYPVFKLELMEWMLLVARRFRSYSSSIRLFVLFLYCHWSQLSGALYLSGSLQALCQMVFNISVIIYFNCSDDGKAINLKRSRSIFVFLRVTCDWPNVRCPFWQFFTYLAKYYQNYRAVVCRSVHHYNHAKTVQIHLNNNGFFVKAMEVMTHWSPL